MIELDHVFLLVDPGSEEIDRMMNAGFVEGYRRKHIGQGTENVCFCFDNFFVELLWVSDLDEVTSEPIARTKLFERSSVAEACPFGIAYRGGELAGESWPFRPAYLPAGMSLPIAVDSDDIRQPLIFKSPGTLSPSPQPPEKRVPLQREIALADVTRITIELPDGVQPCASLVELSERTTLEIALGDKYELSLEIQTLDANSATLRLPSIGNKHE